MNPEERMLLRDLVTSDTWKLVLKMAHEQRENGLKLLLGLSEGSSFHRMQGAITGVEDFILMIESRSKPPESPYSDTLVNEMALRARK